jgi:hypothetical protein
MFVFLRFQVEGQLCCRKNKIKLPLSEFDKYERQNVPKI